MAPDKESAITQNHSTDCFNANLNRHFEPVEIMTAKITIEVEASKLEHQLSLRPRHAQGQRQHHAPYFHFLSFWHLLLGGCANPESRT